MSDPVPTASQEFFNPESPFGTLTGWEPQRENPTNQRQRAQSLKKNGDELNKRLYDGKQVVSGEYVASADNAAIPKVGIVLNGYHVDSLQVKFINNDFVKMTVNGHKHTGTGVTSHATGSCRTYTGSLTALTSMFGIPATLPGLVLPTGTGIRSATYTLQCNHIDEPNRVGDFLAGNNHDGSETMEVELCESGNVTADTGWDLMTDGHSRGMDSAETLTATVEHHIQCDVAA